MSGEDECTICEGGGGWWQRAPDGDGWQLVDCAHCDCTGIEPDSEHTACCDGRSGPDDRSMR